METSQLEPNPYASPASIIDDARQSAWYLASACRYFKRISYVMIVYWICVIPLSLYRLLNDDATGMRELIGVPTMMAFILLFFGALLQTALRLPYDFERLYKRARWLGILAGAFGFPILTIPAFIGVSRLSKYRTLVNGDKAESSS